MSNNFNFYNRPMQQFGQSTLISAFIQNLLSSVELPLCDTVSKGDLVISGNYYIYNFDLIKCHKTGYLGGQTIEPLYPNDSLYPAEDLFPSDGWTGADIEYIYRYQFGKHYDGMTCVYTPKTNYYDSETHYWLGKYLRCIRDIYGVNYMPFYNCFNAVDLPNISKHFTNKYIYAAPIKFNKTYTVSYQLNKAVVVKPILYTDDIISFSNINTANEFNFIAQAKVLNGRNYQDYYKFSINTTNNTIYQYQDYLYILFLSDFPIGSLSIVEGNYSYNNNVIIGTTDEKSVIDALDNNPAAEFKTLNIPDMGDFNLTSKLKLLDVEDRDNSYAFSNRLVEGLLHHTINKQDEICWNIGRVQEKLGMDVDNIWRTNIQTQAFTTYLNSINNKTTNGQYYTYLDINGNIDKDVEYYLFGNDLSS